MHDCRVTRDRLIDLAFDETGETDALRAEAEACPGCRRELRALAETLRAYERAGAEDDPPEQFWPGYHARLSARLRADDPQPAASTAAKPERRPSSASQLRSPLTTRLSELPAALRELSATTWRVPAPVAVAAALLVACLSVLAIRRAAEPVAVNAPAPSGERQIAPAEVRTVEVPVERVVTRVVYVERAARAGRAARRPGFESQRTRVEPLARREDSRIDPRADTLAGFRPAGDVRLRVVKGSYEDEK